ncbi:hypothetical protein [Prevotella multiformis]|jgi:hypothetical protein|uniref:hypothetical protein n=1 Tax=Prevotella multiformis TaxID=282402 RepID=UPI0023F2007A|nr:hypothetical protein [Prevotella multiformis]
MTEKKKTTIRRIGAHAIELPEGLIEQGIAVIEDGIVKMTFPFTAEQPMTEWLSGTITVRLDDEGKPRAYKGDTLLE